jgi:DNA-binding NarL/FixJ family response regulator
MIDPAIAGTLVGNLGRRAPPSWAGTEKPCLSAQEEEILRLVAWGVSNKEIAARLDLSLKTIESHKTSAMQKLGLHNRMDIVRLALLRGWLREI